MCNYIVTDEEIKKAEQDVFGSGLHFNAKQRAFLKCLDSCYLQAYAGTGKTSVIVGKLHILAQKKVWQNSRGVCVISHTNVAVDEIKKHVAKHYPEVMGYPNFVGTIQEFVNKFLFIPFLANKGLQIKFQDDSRYFDYKKVLQDQAVVQRIDNKLKQLNHSNNGDARKDFFERLYTVFLDSGKLYAKSKNQGVTEFTDLTTRQVCQETIVGALRNQIKQFHDSGIFLFAESFINGYEYLKLNPILKNIINQRFQFVFLDEAQDCSDIQLKLLNELFQNKTNTVFQQIGDENQNISDGEWMVNDPLYLGDSARFGRNITGLINKFKKDNGPGVAGNSEETKRLLLIYSAGREKDVLPKFTQYLKDENIPVDPEKGYFAVSHKHDQLCAYYPSYSEGVAKNRSRKSLYRLDNDIDYINLLNREDIVKFGSRFVSNILVTLLYKHFKEKGKTWLEVCDLLRDSDVSNDFRFLVLNVCMDILENNCIGNLAQLSAKLNLLLGENKINLVSCRSSSSSMPTSENKFTDQNGIVTQVRTIHSVKGQTHIATLFFSNKEYSKQDVQHALDNTAAHTPRFKKLIYVASSRAKHLFAFAIPKSAYDQLSDKTIFDGFVRNDI